MFYLWSWNLHFNLTLFWVFCMYIFKKYCVDKSSIHVGSHWNLQLQFLRKLIISSYMICCRFSGNHELGLDPFAKKRNIHGMRDNTRNVCLENLGDSCIFLEDTWVKINGIKIYGSPWFIYFFKQCLRREPKVTLYLIIFLVQAAWIWWVGIQFGTWREHFPCLR